MINRCLSVGLLLILLVSLPSNALARTTTSPDPTALVFVDLTQAGTLGRFAATNLPMFAMLDGGLLSAADSDGKLTLQAAGLAYTVLDPDLGSGTYYLAGVHSSRPVPDFSLYGTVLLDSTSGVILRMDPSRAAALALAGAELNLITLTPKPLPNHQAQVDYPKLVDPDPIIQGMINQVTATQVSTYDRQLAGELAIKLGGSFYVITTRNTYSGTPIQKTTQYVGQHLQDLGMNVDYQQWSGPTNPNVIGEMTGSVDPEDIYIIGAHIDDVNNTPGADDNASGSVATLLAADILSQYQWGCTLRFAFWTGEEQGLLGSKAYALRSYQYGENILGYLNLDMIAYNTVGSPPGIDLLYNPNMPSTYSLAQLFANVITAYDINLIPALGTTLGGGSDHSSFWYYGYTSILSIEDQADFNPYYHSPNDTPAHTDLAYFTNFVKASVGTFAHMTGCLVQSNYGYLDGHVTSTSDGSPISGATLTAENNQAHSYSGITDASGYYTLTLPAGIYTLTASAIGYVPDQVGSLEITPSTTLTHNFALQPNFLKYFLALISK